MPAIHRPLTTDDLRAHGPRRLGTRVMLVAETASTNSMLLSEAARLPDGTLLAAERQTAGRGRMGRTWHAPRGSSILLSVLLHEPPHAVGLPYSMLACVAACEAVEATTSCRPAVSWPNDIFAGGRKLGGVLVETTPLAGGRAVVVGIGLNCLQQRGHFDEAGLGQIATSLEIECAEPIDRAAVAARLVSRVDHWLTRSVADVRRAWSARCNDVGQEVRLHRDGRSYAGTIGEILESGDLRIDLDSGGSALFEAATTTRLR
jgi:BirA family transcriptional regulator, biotin operon repressor / biotin---[acetyl-CoA-carboxylase] ligase